MKTILVPTDFSANAGNALQFAVQLADKLHAKIILLHAYEIPVPVAEIAFDILEEEKKAKRETAEKKLRHESERHLSKVKIETHAVEGYPKDVILRFTKSHTPTYIVMGTKGAGSHAGMFGSNTSYVIERATVPVIAIPDQFFFNNEIKRITFATDYHLSDIEAIHKLADMAALFQAQVNILHVSDEKLNQTDEDLLMTTFMNKVNARVPYSNISFQLMTGKDVEKQLEKYMSDESTDLIAMSTHVRNFFTRLFEKSITKKIALKTDIPLVVFHYNKETALKLF